MIAGGFDVRSPWQKIPVAAIRLIFFDPIFSEQFGSYSRPQLLIKSAPLILIAVGLAIGFRAGIWNIGAEGQYIIGALCGAGVALAFYPVEGWYIFPLMVIAGRLGRLPCGPMIPRHFEKHGSIPTKSSSRCWLVYVAERLLAGQWRWGCCATPDVAGFPGSRDLRPL